MKASARRQKTNHRNQWSEPDEHPIVGQWHVRHAIPAARDTGYLFGKNFATLAEALTFCRSMFDQDCQTRLLAHVEGDRWLMHHNPSTFYYVPGSEDAPPNEAASHRRFMGPLADWARSLDGQGVSTQKLAELVQLCVSLAASVSDQPHPSSTASTADPDRDGRERE